MPTQSTTHVALDFQAEVAAAVRSVFGDDVHVRPELSADELEAWDSLTHIRLMTTLERTFEISFSAAEIGSVRDIAGIVDLVRLKMSSSSS